MDGGDTSLPEGVAIESQIPAGVSWASLLLEASDLDSLTHAPSPGERSVLFSSSADTQKVSLAHLAPEVLGDLDHGFFVRVEDKADCVEATLAEATGPGAITWIWSANPVGTAVLYIDNDEVPALHLPFASLLAGSILPVRDTFASMTAHGHNLHFPIVHSNRFRLAIRVAERKQLSELFYHVAWNSLVADRPIHPFDAAAIQNAGPLLGSLGERFREWTVATTDATELALSFTLAASDSKTIFESDQPGTIRLLEVTARSKAALADLWIEARWDRHSQPAISAPLSMLAGVSAQCENTRSLPCTLSGGRVLLRWPMPFGSASTMSFINKGNRPRDFAVRLLVDERPQQSDTTRLRFHANYAKQVALSLTARNVVTFADITGPGWIVGTSLRVDSRSAKWWGEGDEIIWLDRNDEAAWRGTGTEDYFGFAWCSDQLFHHPLRGQTRADGSRTNRRIAAMHKYHLIDRLPFRRFARFEMEAWGLAEGFMDYETTLMWYAPLAPIFWPTEAPECAIIPAHQP
ncbi:MAG: DUF2961 domain-containing protein [Kiritimatiellae bacterium]|nr:DUF2961 domain-containing protein [Kiritimatiellia bacterium]